MALAAVLLLSCGALALSLSTLGAAVLYADSVRAHELRIQATLNTQACLDSVTLMATKDFFLQGNISVPELSCIATVVNDFSGSVSVTAVSNLSGVTSQDNRSFLITF